MVLNLLIGCDLTDSKYSDYIEFKGEYTKLDYSMDEYEYFEIRHLSFNGPSRVINRVDSSTFENLESEDKMKLEVFETSFLSSNHCSEAGCMKYVVSLDTNAKVSEAEISAFFNIPNNEARLYSRLNYSNFDPISYKTIDNGVRYVVGYDNLCGERGKKLYELKFGNEPTELDKFDVKKYRGCV